MNWNKKKVIREGNSASPIGCPISAILKARPLFFENQRAIAVTAIWLIILWPNKRRPNKDKKSIRSVSALDKRNENHVLGYWIGEEYWGNGYALEACNSLITYFFSNHSGNILYASHMLKNEKSKKILLKLGFQKVSEGKIFSLSKNTEVDDVNYELVNS